MSRAASLLMGLCGVAVVGWLVYQVGPPAVAPKLAFLGQPPADAPPADPAADGMARGVAFLLKQQSDDGAWRSDVYATFKDGTALTPLVLCALQDAADSADSKAARQKASDWLAKMAKPDGTIDEGKEGIPYQVYTASLSVIALSHPENRRHVKARDAWLKYLLDRQLLEQNGWGDDKHYGGWGYYPGVPKKPAPGQSVLAQHLLESNTSATAFALDALRAAEHTDYKRWQAAGVLLLMRLRNPDEGFRFIADDPVRNKAGVASQEPEGEPVFNSYGSATADGARAMWLWSWAMGRNSNREWEERKKKDPNAPRPPPGLSTTPDQAGSLRWLVNHYRPDIHPGTYIPTHEPNRNAVYFYYARSVAKTLCMLSTGDGWGEINGYKFPESLIDALLAKQRPDGSWANPVDLVRENDPVVATAYALTALAECRKALQR